MEKKAFPFLDQITIDNVQNKITESLNEIQYYPPLKVLKIIKLFDVLSKKGQYSEVQESAENIQLREIKRYLNSKMIKLRSRTRSEGLSVLKSRK